MQSHLREAVALHLGTQQAEGPSGGACTRDRRPVRTDGESVARAMRAAPARVMRVAAAAAVEAGAVAAARGGGATLYIIIRPPARLLPPQQAEAAIGQGERCRGFKGG